MTAKAKAKAKVDDVSSHRKSNGPVVGGAVGSAIAAFSTQITDDTFRNIVIVLAPVIAVCVTSIWNVVCEIARNEWSNYNQRYLTRNATKHYQEVLSDLSQPEEVRERAQKAMINAQIATIEFHERNLNRSAQDEFSASAKTQGRRAASQKNAGVKKNDLPSHT